MANPYINKVIVSDQIILDLTDDTVTADKLMQGYTAHDASGAQIVGTASAGANIPEISYTGDYELLYEGNNNWKIKFLSSGTLIFNDLGFGDGYIDAYLVGGGAGCSKLGSGSQVSGGGAGYTYKSSVQIRKNTSYAILVGDGGSGGSQETGSRGGTSSAFGLSAAGGYGGEYDSGKGGNGGSGGGAYGATSIATDGANGLSNQYAGGTGQGTFSTLGYYCCREFFEASGELYAKGGACKNLFPRVNHGDGGCQLPSGSANADQNNGSSGIVIIRNHR